MKDLIDSTGLTGILAPPTEKQMAYFLKMADTNGDGKVSFEEWKVFMKQFTQMQMVCEFKLFHASFAHVSKVVTLTGRMTGTR